MGVYLNSIAPYAKYKAMVSGTYFVDKTALLDDITKMLGEEPQYICITRPRRFGKTVMANMMGSFFSKSVDSYDVFKKLEIAGSQLFQAHLNKHNVIYIDFSEIPEQCDSYSQYITRISEGLKHDIGETYSELNLDISKSVWDILSLVFEKMDQQKFIFILDEWDAVFHLPFISDEDRGAYLLFLKSLLKSKAYVELVYMTGILPITKYSGGSELNMFSEYSMAAMERYSESFGFTDDEVNDLYSRYLERSRNPKVTRAGIKQWYDGYRTAAGTSIYNPRSVVLALKNNQLSNYWTNSGPYDEIFYYIKNHIMEVRDDLALLVAGERIEARIQEYAATASELETKDQIYSAMVVYGLLTFEQGQVLIPNKELMDKFGELLISKSSLGYVYKLAKVSAEMMRATISGDTKRMAELLQYAHNTEVPILSYNHEVELAAVVNLVYLSARDNYRVEREDKAGKGYVDFIFYPIRLEADAIILELKVGHPPEAAIAQIKKKQYVLRLKGKLGETPNYTGRILAVGISYNKKTKEHACKVEVLD